MLIAPGPRLLAVCLAVNIGGFTAGQPPNPGERTSEPRPVAEAEDPVNRLVAQTTVDGLIVQLRIDGTGVTLERAQPAGIRRRGNASPRGGDTVTVTALAGAERVGSARVSDQLRIVQEGGGLIASPTRTIVVAVPTPMAIDAIEVEVSASGTTRRFDVREVYVGVCRALRYAPICGGRDAAASPR